MDPIVIPVVFDTSGLDPLASQISAQMDRAASATESRLGTALQAVGATADAAMARAKKAIDRVPATAERAARGLKDFGDVAEKAGKLPIPGFSTFGGLLKNTTEALSVMLSPMGLATAALVAAGAAAATAATASALLGVAIVGMVAKAHELNRALEPFRKVDGFGVTPETAATAERAGAALDGIGTVAKRGAAIIGNEFAPVVLDVTRVVLALGLAGVDVFDRMAQAGDFAAEALRAGVYAVIDQATGGLVRLIDTTAAVAKAAGVDLPAGFTGARDAIHGFVAAAGDQALASTREAFAGLTDGLGQYMDRADELIDVQIKVNREVAGGGKAAEAAKIAWVTFADDVGEIETSARNAGIALGELAAARAARTGNDAVDAVIAQYDAQISQVRELIDLGADRALGEQVISDITEEMNAKLDAVLAKQAAGAEGARTWADALADLPDVADTAESAFNSVSGGIQDLIDVEIDRQEKMGKAGKERAKDLFRASQALAVAQTIINGEVAAIQALAQLGPVAGPIAAAGIIASSVAGALATITQTAPEFDVGTGSATGGQTDQFLAKLYRGEGVLTRRAVENIGGPRAVDALNAGAAPAAGAPQRISIMFRDRVVDTMVATTARAGGALSRVLDSIAPPPGVATVWR